MIAEKLSSFSVFYTFIGGLVLGLSLSIFATPIPSQNDYCGVSKVNYKPVTAFVLKSPEVAQKEQVVCPAVPKCEVTKQPKSVSKAETVNDDESKPRRYHHRRNHRVRSYWR